jgi:hypothetical protein
VPAERVTIERPRDTSASRLAPRDDPGCENPRSRVARDGGRPGLAIGCFLTWNVSNVGAVADPLAEAYDTSSRSSDC